MGKYSHSRTKKAGSRRKTVYLLALVLVLGAAGAAMLLQPFASAPQTDEADAGTANTATQAPDVELIFVAAGTGDAADVQCKSSYTADSQTAAEQTVARAGDAVLTNETLQILYLSQVSAWRSAETEQSPDFSLPLDAQECPLEDGLSWQQYFLKRAVQSWLAQEAVLYAAAQPQPITEEAYQPDQTDTLHEKYISDDLPVNDFLYQDEDCFQPNSMHQAYLDELDATLDTLAQALGYESLADAASAAGVDAEAWLQAATDYNTAYMYFTEKSYDAEVTDEEIAGYLSANPSSGDVETVVDLRHILIVPEGSTVAADGTVTATDKQWEAARQEAEALLAQWQSAINNSSKARSAEAEFAQMASESSDDAGSSLDGGLYEHIQQGQLIDVLDEWCFSAERQELDYAVLRSGIGYHVVLLTNIYQSDETDAEEVLLYTIQQEQWQQWLDEIDTSVDYSAAVLWADTTLSLPSLEDALYPDIAHERYPEAIVFLQQDYYYYPFGNRAIGSNGCGITTFAMLATYMTDSLQTPAMMSDRFSEDYFDYTTHATDGNIFSQAPAEMGFYLEKMSFDLEEVIEALKNGQVVISRQQKGDFTTSGHFLLLTAYNEEDDTFQVRDSNIYNYGNKAGHRIDRFTRANILSGGGHFYIMQRKVTAIPACARCGGDFEETAPEALLQTDYICEKCTVALARRNRFLNILEAFS